MAVDDLELDRDGVPPPPLPPPPAGEHRWWIVGAVVLALVAGGLARWWTMDRAPVAPAATEGRPEDVRPTEAVIEPEIELPPFDQMDGFLRTLLGALSTRPELARWLATDQLLLQMASAIDRVARGDTPASDLKVLAPDGTFTLERRGRVREVSAASYRRYDGLAETIAGLDPSAIATAYRTIRPRLNEAYQRLGRSESDVDVVVRQALDVLIATPVPEGPIRLTEGRGATWNYQDPALESLKPAQKQLLRMGPENAARVIEMLRSLRQQLQP